MNLWLNRLAPDFSLPMVGGGRLSISTWRGFVTIINFWSAECRWSRRADVLLVYRLLTWEAKGVRVVGVAANANESESQISYEMSNRHLRYPVVLDHDHRVADLYRAETTPHFFVLDRQGLARYIGALDDATSEQRNARFYYLDRAVTQLLAERLPDPAWTQAVGCEIVRVAEEAGAPPSQS